MDKYHKLELIKAYLQAEFPEFALVDGLEREGRGHSIQLLRERQRHFVTVQDDFLEVNALEDIPQRLREYRLAEVLREIGEFEILLTNSGCIFA